MDGGEVKMHIKKLVALFVCFVVYLILGAVMFHHLESDHENEVRTKIRNTKSKILKKYPCLGGEMVEELVEVTMKTVSSGIDPRHNVTSPSNWDYSSAFFFSGTVVTTIGYGKIVPTTDLGRNMCILYALFGIPFTGWLLATVGQFYQDSLENMAAAIEKFLRNRVGCKQRRFRKCLLYSIVFMISYCLLVLVPSAVFYIMEDWTYEEAHYYSFITLSTIGFGDYVASASTIRQKHKQMLWLYDFAVACWYVFGLAYLACIITVVGKKQKHLITKLRTSVKLHAGKTDPEPAMEFALYDVKGVAEETSFSQGNGCTCKHDLGTPRKFSFRDEGTQTTY